MEKLKLRKLLYLLLALTIPLWGVNLANAGPGGGTYFANSPGGGASGTALRKFVDSLPGLGPVNANNLGQYIPVATPDTTTYPGSDYYEIGLRDYSQKMHSDLPKATKLRGYYQVNGTDHSNQYLGPLILARSYDPTKPPGVNGNGQPVRIRFFNNLSTASKGNLFIPVDTSLMGAGMGPDGINSYTQNRATLHLHGGNTPWISDGTPHQWTTPVGETSVPVSMRKGVSTRDVPDMGVTGPGEMTFYYTNQQSNRLMFYHDHALGITRLNVYAGEAAGYLLTEPLVEDPLINTGVLPGAGMGAYQYGIPLVIQDRTFVPQNIDAQDALWTKNSKGVANNWGTYGDLWFPHVYEANQDPTSPDGANPFGRWDYGPWFWPPVIVDAAHSTIPEPSTTPEAFMDTPLVNGTAYPYLTVEPKPYRFRVLNACNDRTLNLSLFTADPGDPLGTEVKMVSAAAPMAGAPLQACSAAAVPDPATGLPANCWPSTWPSDGRAGGVPDPATAGPEWIQIGTEGGFLPAPVEIPATPIGYEYNRRNIVVLNVTTHGLYMQPAERADVIVDFSKYAGKTVILYNDGPAPNPGFDTRYDYYTGDPDQTPTGGAPSTQRGYGPNTRTIMQFRVLASATPPVTTVNLPALQTAISTAFNSTQPVPIVPEPTYPANSTGFGPTELYAKIQDYSFTLPNFLDILANPAPLPTTIPFQPKAIQELWDPYGRMNATLGIELPFTTNLNQTTIPMGYAEPTTENIIDGQPQIWKITHNGVDTHPVHFHMMNVQLVNRVGWDGAIRPPDANELGWKETIKMNPLEDAIVALVPKAQTLPFALPTSTRPIDPTQPANADINVTDFGNLGPAGYNPSATGTPTNGVAATVLNTPGGAGGGYDYGQEYVWHCHILGHEENDFMRPLVFRASSTLPPAPVFNATGANTALVTGGAFLGGQTVPGLTNYVTSYVNPYLNQIVLQWNDGAPVSTPTSFLVNRSTNGGTTYTPIANVSYLPGYPPIYTDVLVAPNTAYTYQIVAFNAIGKTNSPDTATASTGAWANPTNVSLSPSKPSPHVAGTNVQFTAAGVGAPANVAYQYRFSLQAGGGAFTLRQDWSADNTWTLPAATDIGTYAVMVEARTSAAANAVIVSTSVPYQVIPTPQPPVTTASPVPGTYASGPVMVTLSAATNAPPATIYYTTDGTPPTTASAQYIGPITVPATPNTNSTTINYFAVDANGAQEQPYHSDTWAIHTNDLTATVVINDGSAVTNSSNVTLTLNAVDPLGIATMQFSNDGTIYTAEEPYSTTKAWTLSPGDGFKTVYVRFRDKALPAGVLYPPVTASISLSTAGPVTTASPAPGTYAAPLYVRLMASAPSTVYYTTDGTAPTAASAKYVATTPIQVTGTTTIRYFAIDTSGRTEQTNTGTWTASATAALASMQINNGARTSRTPSVTLSFAPTNQASPPVSMQLSNDGVNYLPIEPFAASRAWTLSPGEGIKTVYAQFIDSSNTIQPPVTAAITVGIKDGLIPGTSSYLQSALMALKFANGFAIPNDLELAHADVAPYRNGAAQPDDKIDVGDAYVLLLRAVNLITSF